MLGANFIAIKIIEIFFELPTLTKKNTKKSPHVGRHFYGFNILQSHINHK